MKNHDCSVSSPFQKNPIIKMQLWEKENGNVIAYIQFLIILS